MIEVTGKPDYWVITLCAYLSSNWSREARERGERRTEPGILMWSLRYSILQQTESRAFLSALFPFVYNEGISYFALFGPLGLLIESNEANFNQNNPISETEGSWPESPDSGSQCISIFQMKTLWRSVSWGWQLYTEIMNVFMLKLTHFKSLTFELLHCVPRFIEYTCRIIISNVFHC